MFHLIALRILYRKVLLKKVGEFVKILLVKCYYTLQDRERSFVAKLLYHIVRHLRNALFGNVPEILGEHRSNKRIDHRLNHRFYIGLQRIVAAHQSHAADGSLERLEHRQVHQIASRYLRDGRACPFGHHRCQDLRVLVIHIVSSFYPKIRLLVTSASASHLTNIARWNHQLSNIQK
nr:MAG TPA: hypothetical protein [Caudoviricetes sp.]